MRNTRLPVSLNESTWMIDGQRLDDEHAAHDEQHDLLAHDDRDGAERRAERERADVAHEYLGRDRR